MLNDLEPFEHPGIGLVKSGFARFVRGGLGKGGIWEDDIFNLNFFAILEERTSFIFYPPIV